MSIHSTSGRAQKPKVVTGLVSLLLLSTSFSLSAGTLPTGSTAAKKAAAQEIFYRLVFARGDQRLAEPHFVFSRLKDKGAKAVGDVITLEELAYDVCASLGEEGDIALAGILGHELIHYYEKHEWEGGFIDLVGKSGSDSDRSLDRSVKEDNFALKKDEIEADYLGGFLAHLAGYPATNIMPKVLQGIYDAYELPEEMSKYPPLRERQRIATETYAKLVRLVDVFEMGNMLVALRKYDAAAYYYQYLINDFQGREVYNNVGVAYTMAALPMFKPESTKYLYPVELDLSSRLATQTRSVGVDRETREYYLEEAIWHFRQAGLLDVNYAVGMVNRASAHLLLGQSLDESPKGASQEIINDHYLEAGLWARRAIRLAEKLDDAQAAANGHLVLGILAHAQGNDTEVAAAFAKAAASPLTALNESIRTTGKLPPAKPKPDAFDMEETIDGKSLAQIEASLPDWTNSEVISARRPRIKLESVHPAGTSTSLLLHTEGAGRSSLLLYSADKGYSDATALEISLGATQEEIIEEYDQPDYFVPSAGGLILVYKESRILFVLRGDKLVRWYLFAEE
ncbi:MAG: hypothetical protein AAGA31_05655 [Bacteroidota bacterium]